MILALILAASLESESIGDFFALANWIPRSVESVNTPGSDPDSGGGWYIDEYTNAWTWSDWTVSDPNVEKPTRNGPTWDLYPDTSTVPDWYRIVFFGAYPSPVYDPTNELSHVEWSNFVTGYPTEDSEYTELAYGHYEADRSKTPSIEPTGRKVPRSPRLSDDVMAGVNSTFEAFFERMYFASQGQTNSWNEAQWGPRLDFRTFWFKPSVHGGGEDIGWDYGTNRTVVSRRLNEWEHIDSLASYLQSGLEGGYRFGVSSRPGWVKEFWWATTASEALADSYLVPSFDWMRNPTQRSMRESWKTASRIIGTLFDTDSWWGGVEYSADYPTAKMMAALDFGQNASARHDVADDWYYPDYCIPDAEGTVNSLIETNFPHADGGAVTNDTRRLFSDRLCCVNQFLGTIDRTYHLPEISWADYGSNIYKTVSRVSIGTVPCTLTWNGSEYTVRLDGSLTWIDSTNTVNSTPERVASDGLALYYRISESTTAVDYSVTSTDPYTFGTMDDNMVRYAYAQAKDHGFVPTEGRFVVALEPRYGFTTPVVFCNVFDSYYHEYQFETGVSYPDVVSTSFTVPFVYRRGFYFERSEGRVPELGPIQPGWQSLGRAGESHYGAVEALHTCYDRGAPVGLTTLPWDITKSNCEYKSSPDSQYTGVVSLKSGIESLANEAYQRFVQWAGFDPESVNPVQLIPIDNADFRRVRDSVVITPRTTATYDTLPRYTYVTCSLDGGGELVIEKVETYQYQPDVSIIPGYDDLFVIVPNGDIQADVPSATEMKSKYADIRIGVITRTDWQWKTLKRE